MNSEVTRTNETNEKVQKLLNQQSSFCIGWSHPPHVCLTIIAFASAKPNNKAQKRRNSMGNVGCSFLDKTFQA